MNFHKNCWEYSSYNPKHPCQFLAKSIENFYFYLNLFILFFYFQIFFNRISIFKTRTGKNMQISSQKSKSVSLRPINEKKIIAISFFVREICLLENRRALSRQFGRPFFSSICSKTIQFMEIRWYLLQNLYSYLCYHHHLTSK